VKRHQRVRGPASLGQRAVAALYVAASAALSALPRRLVLPAAWRLGRASAALMPARLAVARENVRAALGDELDAAAREALARDSFGAAAAMAFDLLTLPRVARDPERYCLVDEASRRTLEEARRRGRGTILLAGHFGLFESMGIVLGHLGSRPSFVAKPLANPALDAAINARRTATGNTFIHKGGAGARLRAILKAGGTIAIVVDQHVTARDRLWVPFFGLPAATTRTLGVLARATGAAVVPIHAFPLAGGRARCELGPPILAPETGDPVADGDELVRRAIAAMEEAARRQPGAWLWLHRRWKVRPRDEPGRYPAYSISEAEEARRAAARRAAAREAHASAPGGA
jgi:KDO2-lipid IV(A) lauroyltransferase